MRVYNYMNLIFLRELEAEELRVYFVHVSLFSIRYPISDIQIRANQQQQHYTTGLQNESLSCCKVGSDR